MESNEVTGGAHKCMPAAGHKFEAREVREKGEEVWWPAGHGHGHARGLLEPLHIHELAELYLVGEDHVVQLRGHGDVRGVRGIGEVEEEAVGRPKVGSSSSSSMSMDGNDADDLQEHGAMRSPHLHIRVRPHVLDELYQHSWYERRHTYITNLILIDRGDSLMIDRQMRNLIHICIHTYI